MSKSRTLSDIPLRGVPVVLSGPAGVGKTVVAGKLVSQYPDLARSVSATSRPRRPGEKEGRDYHFISREEFDRRLAHGDFLEHTEHLGHLYGTLREPLARHLESGRDVLLTLDVRGGEAVRRGFEQRILIFLWPPSVPTLARRLKGRRRDSEEEIGRRLALAAEEARHVVDYDYVVVNDDLQTAADTIRAVILADRQRRRRILPALAKAGIAADLLPPPPDPEDARADG